MGQSRCREAAGFTMLEALVAIVVLAFGVLGVANLLIKSFRFAQQSSYDVVALQIAADMADRMRANDDVTNAGGYSTFDSDKGIPTVSDANNPYITPCAAESAACAALMATFDEAEWARQIKSSLPGGRAVVCRDATAFNANTGYAWGCTAAPGVPVNSTPLVVKIGWVSRFTDTGGTDVPTGKTMADSRGANGAPTPQIVMVVMPGIDN